MREQLNPWYSLDSEESETTLQHLVPRSATNTIATLPEEGFHGLNFWLRPPTPVEPPTATTSSYEETLNSFTNIQIPETLVASDEAIATEADKVDFGLHTSEEGESSGAKRFAGPPEVVAHIDTPGRVSKKSRADRQPRRTRSAELHNMTERVRRDRINSKMRDLQGLIPKCSTRDKASVLEDAIKYIESMQNHIKMMSMGSDSNFQAPYILPENYQGFQVPQYAQFMQMAPGIGMPTYGLSPPAPSQRMPFGFASPYQSNFAASPMPIFVPLPQTQMTFNPFGSLPSTDTISQHSTSTCSTQGEGNYRNEPNVVSDLSQVNPTIQGLVASGPTARALPTQIVAPSSTGDSKAEIQQKPMEEYEGDSILW